MSLTFIPNTIEFFPEARPGEVEETIPPRGRGRVRFIATTWFAQFYDSNTATSAVPGSSVIVIGREGLTLLVVPTDCWIHPPIPGSEVDQVGLVGWMQHMRFRFANWLR